MAWTIDGSAPSPEASAALRTAIGLGTAATTDVGAYATAAQGAKADSALQPSMLMPRSPVGSLTLGKFRAALAKTISGVSDTNIVFISDSTWRGVNSTLGTARVPSSAPNVFAKILNAWKPYGLSFSAASWWGDGNMAPASDSDYRVSLGTFASSTGKTLGGFTVMASTNGTFSFAPGELYNSVTAYYTGSGASGSMDIAGSGPVALSAGSTVNIYVASTSVASPAVQPVNFSRSAGNLYLCGLACKDTSKKQVYIHNAAVSGATSATPLDTSKPWSYLNMLTARLIPDLAVINLAANDWRNVLGSATTIANLTTLCNAMVAAGSSILIVTPVWDASTLPDASIQQSYVDAIKAFAISNGYGLLDTRLQWPSYSAMNARGVYDDTIHLAAPGSADWARMMAAGLFASV